MSGVDRAALREAIADALPFTTSILFHGPHDFPTREMRVRTADALLAGPLAPLLNAAEALAALTEAVGRGDEVGLPEAYRAALQALTQAAAPAASPHTGDQP